MQHTCSIETMCAMNADNVQWIVGDELIDQFDKALCLVMGRRFAVSATLQFHVLTATLFNFPSIVESLGVRQIDPQTDFGLTF